MTTQLTPHFALEEFQHGDPIPPELIPIFRELCETILEPVHLEFCTVVRASPAMDEIGEGRVIVTSGYRSPRENAAAHGQPNSEHLATPMHCATDFLIDTCGTRAVFDWMRHNPSLPFHQLIYETDAHGGAIVHVSINKLMPGVRSVLIGATHNAAPYQKVDYVAYSPPPQPPEMLASSEG
ncbi:MAG: hypothetical protein E6H00_12890 [Bacillati bacterium ANGP1]|uniref:Peptidase M15A C-terminal domain-containing protein n=1 Tax=Candidatus Segetimicrobium genomatis TaxID=2569760 RepID=A0A537JXQ4_9BACT|nr:MAG: hypothetical protein E6H00_12890 [Terrabacteria group bacterium ANGP1]